MAKRARKKSAKKGEKDKALEAGLAKIEKDFGKGAVMRMGKSEFPRVDVISTGSIAINLILGNAQGYNCGIHRGRMTELYGPEGGGKSTLALQFIAEVQRMGEMAAYVDAEQAFDPDYAQNIGVNVGDLLVSQPDSGEEALTIVQVLIKTKAVALVIVDSVAMLIPKAEKEAEMGESIVAARSRLMSQALGKLKDDVRRANAALVLINQIRDTIGSMGYGPKTTTPGGHSIKHGASVRIEVRRKGILKRGDVAVGARTIVKTVKNRLGPPWQKAEFDLIYGEGVSRECDVLDLAVEHGIIKKSGAFFVYGEESIANGREATRKTLRENQELLGKIESDVLKAIEAGFVEERVRVKEEQAALKAAGR